MIIPPYGLHLRVVLVKVRDGDTIVVRCRSSLREWAVRLLDCWAPEKHTEEGQRSKEHMEMLLKGEDISLFVPFENYEKSILDLFTFDRVLGHIYTNDNEDIGQLMVDAGMATKEKPVKGRTT